MDACDDIEAIRNAVPKPVPLDADCLPQPIEPGLPVALDANACLSLRFTHIACSMCTNACPAQALTVARGEVALAQACVGCGQCAAACPTGALFLADFEPVVSESTRVARVDCRRVPIADSPLDAVRVPCIGGLRSSKILEWVNAGVPVSLIDRGLCKGCAAHAAATNPVENTHRRVTALLTAAGADAQDWVMVEVRPLSPARALLHPAAPVAERPLNRRGFFAGLARKVAATVANTHAIAAGASKAPAATRHDAAGKILPRETLRRTTALQQIADRAGKRNAGMPSITLDERCASHQVCAAVCPTGALRQGGGEDHVWMAFHPGLCIGCAACAGQCPSRALRFLATGSGDSATWRQLTRFGTAHCEGCGARFVPAPQSNHSKLCVHCGKSRALAKAGFQALFGAR